MGKTTGIAWTDHTFNPWIGCTKVSPGCANCYAADLMDRRLGRVSWGGPRRMTSDNAWRQPVAWNAAAARDGVRRRVFCASLADVFDGHPSITSGIIGNLWHLIRRTPHLDWLLLTKRPHNISKMLPDGYGIGTWGDGWPNVWLGTTAENQAMANERIPHLLQVPARIHFLSCEPLLEDINALPWLLPENPWRLSGKPGIDWIIVGGESGAAARPMSRAWVRNLFSECRSAGVPFFFKQWGEFAPDPETGELRRIGRIAAGHHLDGHVIQEFPKTVNTDISCAGADMMPIEET